jgi:PAS domain S-box-containing protein
VFHVALHFMSRKAARAAADPQQMLFAPGDRFANVIETAMDAIVTVDEKQRIVVFNPAAEQTFGYRKADVIGKPLDMLMPERLRMAHRRHVERFGETGVTSRRMGSQQVLVALRSDGSEFPIEASLSQHADGEQKLYTAILRDVTARFEAIEALRKSKEELQQLGAAAHLTREQEKSRIARELHDELGQSLTMLQMDVAWCKDKAPQDDAALRARLERMTSLLKSTIAATRRIASDLRPLMLDDLGLVPSIEWLVENFTQRTGIACELTVAAAPLEVSQAQASAIFRIIQESLTNVARHAQASHAEVAIEQDEATLIVRVEDNGVGFVLSGPRKPNSLGLYGLHERAALLGGEAKIVSSPGQGTMVEARLPLVDPTVAA